MTNLSDINKKLSELKDWSLEMDSLTKEFLFKSFHESRVFVNKVSEIADKNTHFPTILFDNLIVRISLSTRNEGISDIDFQIAKEIDNLYK